MNRFLSSFILASIVISIGMQTVQTNLYACPMCKVANESDQEDKGAAAPMQEGKDRPKAYMFSILFMLAMPATLFSIFALSFYLMIRKARQMEPQRQFPGGSKQILG